MVNTLISFSIKYNFLNKKKSAFTENYNSLTVILCFWWVLICLERWSDLINFLLHSIHWNLFSPVCVLLCLCNSSDLVNRFPQNNQLHTNGRSPVCHLKWARKCEVLPYTLLHPGMWQICCFLRSACLSPSAQFGHVHATRRTLCFWRLSWFCSPAVNNNNTLYCATK